MSLQAKIDAPPELLEILAALQGAGYAAHLVGGCVRDSLLGRTPQDLDIATSARTGEIQELFPDSLNVGAAFGVIVVKTPKGTVEVASFREEGDYLDGRHPSIIRYSDAKGDARRRDFTVNALFWDPKLGILDYTGGLDDLDKKLLRCVGIPAERFQEDKLRILRGVRFKYILGFDMDPTTEAALKAAAPALGPKEESRPVSPERIETELSRILERSPSGKGFKELYRYKLEEILFPELSWTDEIRRRLAHARSPLGLWALLCKEGGLDIAERLRLPKATVKGIQKLFDQTPHFAKIGKIRKGEALDLLNHSEIDSQMEYLEISLGFDAFQRLAPDIERLRKELESIADRGKEFLNGAELLKMGVPSSARMGRLIRELHLQKLEGTLKNEEQARDFVGKWLAGSGQ